MKKLTKKNIEDIYALTPMQQGMLFHYLKDPDGEHYFEQLILHISGKIDVELFKKAWKKVVETNEMLRTVFRWENLEQPIQIILKEYEPKISFTDFSHESTSQKKDKTEEIKRKDREKKFHLEEVPFRVTLCKIEEDKYEMVVSNHHILYDGWSNGIILKEFFNTYKDISSGEKTTAPRKTKFKEFVRWTNNQDTGKQEVFWSEYLKDFAAASGEKEVENFRTKRSKNINCAGNYQTILAAEIKGRLDDFVKKHNITLAPVLYSAWGILLLLLCQDDRVLFDTTVSGRTKEIKGIEDMVGLFINTLPLGIKTRGDQNLLALVSGVYQSLQKWEKFENTSQVIVKEYLEKCSRESFFDALVVLENYPLEKQLLQTSGELTVDSFSITGGAHYDITLIITIFDEIKLCFTYNKELFNEETTAALSHCFVAVIDEIVTNSFKTLLGIHQLLTEEREKILNDLKISRQPGSYPDEVEYTAPRNELEEKVAGIWAKVLNIDKSKIGIDADFFAFGGHSLKANMLASLLYRELHVKVPLSEIFHRPTIRELVEYIKGAGESRYARFPGAETKEYYPLSSAQRRFYMLQQLDMGSIAYNAYLFMILEGKIHRDKLGTTFSRLIRRHESLRTAFIYYQGEPWQKALPEVNFTLKYFEITSEESKKIITGFIRPFDLSKAPLMRVGLIKLNDENEKYILLFDMHHIISDGSSVNILVKEFMELYQGIRLPIQKYQYKDFSEWQNNQLKPGKLKPQEKFWLDQFKGEIPVLDMPCDYPRPAIRSFEGERRTFYLNETLAKGLSDLTRRTGTTLYMVLLAGLGILLNKYAGARDIIIGTPIAGRNHKDLMNIFGLLLEMIVLRIYPEDWKRFTGYLKEIKDMTLASFDNQAYPFGELIKQLSLRDDLSRNPLFDIMLIVQNQGRPELEIDDLKISPLEFENHTSKVDINIEVFEFIDEKEKGIRVELEYCTKLFKRETMERFFRHFEVILNQVVNDSDLKVGEIDIVTEEERKQVLELFNDTKTGTALVEWGGSWLLDELFKARVEKIPDNIALVGPKLQITNYKTVAITYQELYKKSTQLAYVLRKKGVGPGAIVGIMGERSIDTVIGIWGILKAGGAYLPIDPGYPQERIDYMLKDSGASILLATEDTEITEVSSSSTLTLTSTCQVSPANLAYVMYTSGTTGKPKGVLVEQESVVNVVDWFARIFGLDQGTHLLQLTDYTFDPSVEDIFATLLHGGVFFIADKELVFYRERFCDFVQRHEVHIINYVPLVLNKLLGEGEKLKSVRVVISGGEKLDENVKDRIIGKGYRLYNNYGPTEVTVDALSGLCTGERVTLGKPIFNVSCYIMDNRGCLVPVGVVGELWISGAGVARGYLNRPELTNEKLLRGVQGGGFLEKSPPGRRRQKIYKTGDLARWLGNGNIEFLGRLDRQVKIRGYRVELGEIEKELSTYKGINEAAAVPLGNSVICAYFTSSIEKSIKELRYFLSQKLPDYMIPAYFIRLEEMPLTASGKINIHALPDPRETGIDTGMEYVPPTSESERVLVNIWQKILGIQRVGIEDNFFEMGGDSIRMIQCIVRVREEMEREISLKTFFENPTIKLLSVAIAGKGPVERSIPPIVPVSRDRKIPLSFPQEQVWFLQKLYKGYMSYHVPRVIRIKGDLDISLLERTFSEIVRRHEILRTVFPAIDNQPVQKILEPFPVRIPVWDLIDMEAGEQEAKVNALLDEEGRKEFDLERGPMMRLSLLKLKPAGQLLVLVEHHLVHDGWTQGVMLREFIRIYRAYSQGKPSPLAELFIQYADFAVWQKEYMQGERLERHLDYWKKKLAGLPLLLELPTDYPRPPVISGRGDVKRLRLSRELCAGLRKFSKNHDTTLFMTMLAGLKVLLYRYTGTEDLCVGSGISNRQCREIESMLGMVINTLPLRTPLHPGWSFKDFLEHVKETCQEAYEHEDTPFDKIVEAIRPERSLSYTPLFNVIFTFLDTPTEALSLPGLELNLEEFHNRSSKYDINIVPIILQDEAGNRENQEIIIEWEYSTDIFNETTTDRMLKHYNRLLQEILTHADKKISELSMLDKGELELLLYTFNDTKAEYPDNKTLRQLFEEQVEKTPDCTALVLEDRVISYHELNKKANQTAHLLKAKGLTRGSTVVVMAERRPGAIIGIIAILKCAASYLPVDPEYPEKRVKYMIKDSQARLLLSQHPLQGDMSLYAEAVHIDEEEAANDESSNPGIAGHPKDPAYVLYTSGSTGPPKGVVIEQLSIINLAWAQKQVFNIDARDHILQFSTLCFDASVEQIFIALFSGAVLVLVGKNTLLDKDKFEKYLLDHQVTHIHAVPSFLETIAVNESFPLKRVVAGGDKCPKELALRWHKRCSFYNEYGPTETTVTSIELPVTQVSERDLQLPIGRPLHNTYIYILDQEMNPVPFNVTGEIYIGGPGAARGYLNNPELSNQKLLRGVQGGGFLEKSPPGRRRQKIYKTGDLARWRSDGNIEFLGRIDFQVKIRGFRIELGEIESRLLQYKKSFAIEGVTYCKRCLLSSNFPGIHFDDQGICSICREYEEYKDRVGQYFQGIEDFKKLMEKAGKRKRGKYDCMLLFSGGKDSSYVLYRLVEMGLNVLAFTFDNGYISPTAFENIRRITSTLKVESIVCKTDNMKEIFRESLNRDHTVCSGCFKALTTISTRLAVEKNINVIVTGLSRGQIMDTKLFGLAGRDIFDVPEIEEKLLLFRKMYHSTTDKTSQLLNITLEDNIFDDTYFVDFFRYEDTAQARMKEYLRERDSYWRRPGDTGFCSTNCMINNAGIYVHMKERGYHNYEAPLSWTCRLGRDSREELLSEVQFDMDFYQVRGILEEIGYREQPIREAVVVEKQDPRGEKYLWAYYVSEQEIHEGDIRKYLEKELPGYMVPAFFTRLERLPLTPTGKIDRKALPESKVKTGGVPIVPANLWEEKLMEIWSELLGIEKGKIGIHDNFFELGGHSLKATIMMARIHKELEIKIDLVQIFKNPNISGLAALMEKSNKNRYARIETAEKKEYYPLSSPQKRLYFLQMMEKSSTAYNLPLVMKLEGKVQQEKLEKTFEKLIRGHESFRTSFLMVDEEPVQGISKVFGSPEPFFQKGFWPPEAIIKSFIRPFELSQAPLLRVGLVKLPHTPTALRGHPSQEGKEDEYLFMVDMHHIISDGISMGVLVKEFMALYEGGELPPMRLHYKDFVQWEVCRQAEIVRQEAFWLKEFSEFADEIPVLDLPLDYMRPKVQRFEGKSIRFEIDGHDTGSLKNLALQRGTTLYTVLLAVYNIFLARISSQEVIIVGTPTASRRHADLEQVIGMFVNTLALKNVPAGEKRFHSFLEEVKDKTLNAFANQDYPYEELVEKVVKNRDPGRNPLFDAMLVLQNLEIPTIENPGLKLELYPYDRGTSKFDLTLICAEIDDRLSCTLEYRTALFKQETGQRLVNYLKKLVTTVPRDLEQQILRIDMLPEKERKQLVMDFNDTSKDFPKDKTIYQLFEEQVDRYPDCAALVFDHRTVTFRNFDGRANQLARYLQSGKGLQPGDRVAILMDRSIELVIVLMAAIKARGAYVPLEAALPVERLRTLLNDSSTALVVSQQRYLRKLTGMQTGCDILHTILCKEDLPKHIAGCSTARPRSGHPGDPAYVMYTSGSSGVPKGVLVEHRTIVNTIIWRKNNYEYAPGHASLQIPPYFFDSSVTDIFTPLLGGARLVLVRDEERSDLAALRRIIIINLVSHFIVVPVFYNVMLEEMGDDLKYIKMVCCAGDNFPDELIKKHFERLPRVRIFNEYGPTENSVNTTAYELEPHSPKALIGKPISNVRVYILDRDLSLCPIGVTGELCLAGSSLARGYLNRPEMTNQKFCLRRPGGSFEKPPPGPPQNFLYDRLYKTGDLGRWLSEGNLEFLGRADNQVKIRGIRVEIGEIENQLMKHDQIKEAVVRVRQDENGADCLCAYLVPHTQGRDSIKPGELKEYLSQRLPNYMVPSYIREMKQLPLKPNGKLDVKVLPKPRFRPDPGDQYQAPRNHIEKKLVEIWKSVLGKDNIGSHDNFFYIGGDSIKSIQIMSRMNRAGYKLEMKDIFQYPVISELAPHVKKLQRTPNQSPVTGEIPLTPIQAAFFNSSPIDPQHFNQAVMFYSAAGFDREVIEKIFAKIQEHHDALRITYQIDSETGEVRQINHGPDFPLSLQEYDINSPEELEEKINDIQRGINLEKGPLMKLGLFHPDDGHRLLIVIHHLVIDGISWRILFEDIETLYGQYQRGEKPVLPPKTDSFKHWSEKLQDYAHHKNFLEEKAYWTRLELESAPPIKKDFPGEENAVKDTRGESFSLSEAETALLLDKVNRCYRTEINDILLTALAAAIKKSFGQDRVLLALEGHGREQISEHVDTSRTIGWFTTEYPVLIDVSYADDTGRQIKEIKETLRNIPNKGIGSGILKYLAGDANKKEMEFKLKPQIIFNYLGQFDAEIKQISSFKIAKESTGSARSLRNQREYELEINGIIANKRLSMTIYYNETHFKPETMASLAGHFQSRLEHIIAFCAAKETIEPTPSDFTYKGLSIRRLQGLMETYRDIEDIYTLSPMQEGMLFHALVDEASESYFEQTSFRLQGELDIGLVEKSLNQLVKRHDILRTAFVHKDTKRPVQVVLKNRPVDFYYRDIRHIIDSGEQKTFAREFKAKDKKRSFDLSKDILVRASVLRLDQWAYEFTWSFHHILMDGWCIGILISEFFEIYSSYVDNRPYGLPPVKPYRTYIQWLEKQDKEESGRFWQNYLDCFEEPTGIPNKKIAKKENQPGYSNKKVSFQLSGEKTKMLNQLAARHHVTLNIVNQTIWGTLLGRYNDKEDVVFGAVVSGRPFQLEGVESMVGLFINTIPVRIRYQEKIKFHQLLQKVQAEAIAAEPYHYHALADIQSRAPLKQNLMDHLFVFENYPIAEQIQGYGNENNKTSSFQLTDVDVFEQTNFDFNILLSETDQLRIAFQYNANAVDHGEVEQIAHHYRLLLNQVIENEKLEIGTLTLLTPAEKNRLLYEFNETAAEYTADSTIHESFEAQVERTPNHAALLGPEHNARQTNYRSHRSYMSYISYRELNQKSQQLADLLEQKGVAADTIVGIMVDRSIEMVIGILGILKAGGVYLPIDPEYPQARIDYMLKDSQAKILLTEQEFADFSSPQALYLSEGRNFTNDQCPMTNDQLAYIIYTSGSTGKPKGVIVKHRSAVNILSALQREYPLEEPDTYLLKTSYTFDVSVAELFGWFLGGGRLAILEPSSEKDPRQILQTIVREYITHINFVPSMFNLFVEILNHQNIDRISSLRYIFLAGEVLLPGLVERFKALNTKIILENIYGPTEGTIYTSRYSLRDWTGKGGIPIGKPMANIKLYILGKDNHLQPISIAGELCIAGAGLARGYLNRPELTAEKFCLRRPGGALFEKTAPPGPPRKNFLLEGTRELAPLPDKKAPDNKVYMQSCIHASMQYQFHYPITPLPHSPIYRTGDWARWMPDENVEFLGRIDFQVKVRGFRVELGEIENRLNTHPLIKEAVVIDRNDRERKYLCAYFTTDVPIDVGDQTSQRETVSVRQLKEYLEGKLPGYMVPACFVKLDRIPLKANGKIDRPKLPPPLDSDIQVNSIYQAPVTDMQRTIADIWQEVLGREKIGIRDNFFDLGGNSLDFVAVSNKLREKLDKEVPVAALFTHPLIEDLTRYLTAVELPGTSVTVPGNFVMLNGSPWSIGNIFLVHEVLGDVGAYMEFSKQLGTRYNCWGVEAEKLKNYAPQNVTIEEISAKYIRQMKTIQPHGPYNLATWSWGGHLGLEMALQLEKMGEKLSFLAFFDCSGPDYKKNNHFSPFTLETEKDFLRKFFTATGNQEELEKINDIQQLWIRAVEVLTGSEVLVAELRQLLIKNALALPDYDELSGEELVQYLNLDRMHASAGARYIPVGKLHTPIHYFWANQNRDRVESWKDYCHNPVVYHEINGDHHSIFRNKEQIAEFARLFKDLSSGMCWPG